MKYETPSKARIILSYIFENLKVQNTFEACLAELEKISHYCKSNNIELDKRSITYIIKNSNIIQSILNNIICNSKSNLLITGIQSIAKDEITLLFLLCYCKMNSIPYICYSKLDYHVMNGKDFTKEEETKYLKLIKQGDKEVERFFILANIPLVKSIASQFNKDNKFELDELIQEGILGMIIAIRKFDISQEIKFISYAKFWIAKYVMKAIKETKNVIKIPDSIICAEVKITKAFDSLSNKLQRTPTIEEISAETHLSIDKIGYVLKVSEPVDSLNRPLKEDSIEELQDFLVSEELPVDELVIKKMEEEKLMSEIHSCLTEKEITFLYLRYGITEKAKTLQEIGDLYGVTRERVRQIISKAIKKLKQNWNEGPDFVYEENNLVKKGAI